jgi:hypothetical protein
MKKSMSKPVVVILTVLLIILSPTGCATPTQPPLPTDRPPIQPSPSATQTFQTLVPTASLAPTATSIPDTPTPTQIPKVLLPVRGVIGPFERRGFPSGYYEGQILHEFNNYDPSVGSTVADEIGVQLEAMRSLGINTIWLTLSAADSQPGEFVPPACTVNPSLGPLFPQPTESELTNLKALFDLIHSYGIQVVLNLSNTHMEDLANSETWLKSILEVVKEHPALYLVLFSGDIHLYHNEDAGFEDFCGSRAEVNVWAGPGTGPVEYLKWAFPFAHSLGIPYRKLSAEAIVGLYIGVAQVPNPFMTDGHHWDPAVVIKGVFDDLGIPDDQRTYAISFYEHNKCYQFEGFDIPCEDEPPHPWAIETLDRFFDVIGRDNGARVVAVESGYSPSVNTDWNSELAWESLIWLYQVYGIEGGVFWLWTYSENAMDLNPSFAPAIKQRGLDFTYNSVKDILEPLYTQGQTNDLTLTPDSVPPVIGSISATPTVVKNGDLLEISASLGETHLFVWVEMSSLDSDKTSQVVLIDQGDGTYTRNVTLSAWNIQPNGVKRLKVTAMDFWSNTSSTVLNVTLDNPLPVLDAQPPHDDFSGSTLDARKWSVGGWGGATVSQDDRLIFVTDSGEANSSGEVTSNWSFEGDFDVQVTFELGEGWDAPPQEHLDGAYLGASIAGQEYRITRLRSQAEDKLFSWSTADQVIADKSTPALSGKFRMVRTGTVLTFLFDLGDGWQEMTSRKVPSGPAQVRLGNGSIGASMAFTTYFDDFTINSGVTTYKP